MIELLTDAEREALTITTALANKMRAVIGGGPQAEFDWAEAVIHIHGLQHMMMAQAAARAYPDQFRLLGDRLVPEEGDET